MRPLTDFLDIRYFGTREEAQKEADSLLGWVIEVKKAQNSDCFYIQCNGTQYLCEDGYVK